MRYLILVLLLTMAGSAQTKWPATPKDFTLDDIPGAKDDSMSLDMVFKCTKLSGIINEHEDLSEVKQDVLEALPEAAQRCFASTVYVEPKYVDLETRIIGIMVDARFEIDKRNYAALANQYRELAAKYKELLEVGMRLSDDLSRADEKLRKQGSSNNALSLYLALPKYSPPPIPIYQPVVPVNVHCTSRKIGDSTYTDCN